MPTSGDINKEWHLTQTGSEEQPSITTNVIQLKPPSADLLPEGFVQLSDFLDQFDAEPEIAERLPAARQELAAASIHTGKGQTLRDLRLAKGWSQAEFATLIGTSQARVSRLEARREKPSEDTIRELAISLDVDFNTLMNALKHADNK